MTGLSVNGDSQGVDRILGALSAHMWPGMTLKSGDKIMEPSLPENQGFRCYLLCLSFFFFFSFYSLALHSAS